MKKINLFFTILAMSLFAVACSDNIQEMDVDLESPESFLNMNNPTNTVSGASYTNTIGSGIEACTEYFVYASASGGFTTNYDRRVRITVVKDGRINPTTGVVEQPTLMEQHVLTIPTGSSVSAHRRVMENTHIEYDQDFTYRVEEITDTLGVALPGYVLEHLTYEITNNCTMPEPDGGGASGITGNNTGCGTGGVGFGGECLNEGDDNP